MKVVHITPTYFDSKSVIGGGERFPLELAKAMRSYVDTKIVTFGRKGEKATLWQNVPMKIYPGWNTNNLTNPINPFFLQELLDADIIHCHQYLAIVTNLAIFFGRLFGKKVFVTDVGGGGWNLAFYINLTRFLNGYLALSQNAADLARHCIAPLHIIYAGVDTELYRPTRPKERKVIFVGRFIPNKGIDVLIDAMPADIPLHIIGTPYDERYYEDLKKMALGKKVYFLTGLSDSEIVDEYSSAMACVLPSVVTNRYGGVAYNVQLFALPPIEAMSCETVPIATNLFAHPEIIHDGVTGYLVPPNDPTALRDRIEYILAHPAEAEEMAKRGREEVQKRFTWDAVARRCLKAYASE